MSPGDPPVITTIGEIVRGDAAVFPPYLYEAYRSTIRRAPRLPLVDVPLTASELITPRHDTAFVAPEDADLTRNAGTGGEALGQRIIVTGRVIDENGVPVDGALLEVWQANAAGRYVHHVDQHPAPLDPNFTGAGRCLTDDDGRYRFVSIKPGPYPWKNHDKAWRPAHIHFSLFGNVYAQRLVTQMYFPNDPLFPYDPIFNSIPDQAARERLVSRFSLEHTVGDAMLGYEFDIVLRGRGATPFGL